MKVTAFSALLAVVLVVPTTDLHGFYDVPEGFSEELRTAFTDGGGTLWRDIRISDTETGRKLEIFFSI